MSVMTTRLSIDATKVRQAKAVLGTRTTQETIVKALDFAIEATSAQWPVLSAQKQRRLDLLLDEANAGRLTPQQNRELHRLVREAQLFTLRKARLLAGALVK